MQNPTIPKVLALADRSKSVAEIAVELEISPGYVYSVLREHRPDRPRKAHRTRSDKPSRIAMLHLQGAHPDDIGERLGVSRSYVYRHLPRGRNGDILPPCPVPVR
jgi:DNA-binding CsgD family transcriptional regulator